MWEREYHVMEPYNIIDIVGTSLNMCVCHVMKTCNFCGMNLVEHTMSLTLLALNKREHRG